MKKIKWLVQRMFRGYSDVDVLNLDYFIAKKIQKPLHAYVKHQEEKGMSLPNDFASNPTEWLITLSKIKFSFDQKIVDRESAYNPLLEGMTDKERDTHYKKIDEGFVLFGKYFLNLYD